MKRLLLGLGSNKSFNNKSPLELLAGACEDLQGLLADLSLSSVYKTRAMYVENQDDFYNMAALGFVPDESDPFIFLDKIHEVEAKFGRNREVEIRFGPRPLDIDIELFGSQRIETPILQIPHPRIKERAFVLIPAIEILSNPADEIVRNEYSGCLKALEKAGQADGIEKLGKLEKLV